MPPSKKDFLKLADMIRDYNADAPNIGQRPFDANQLELLASFFYQSNRRFKMERWLDYIKGESGPSGGKR